MTIEEVEKLIPETLIQNAAHKKALREKIFCDIGVFDEDLTLVSGGVLEENTNNICLKDSNRRGGVQ